MTDEPPADLRRPAPAPTPMSAMFGRSLLYVVIWSLQLLVTSISSPILAHLLGPGDFGLVSTAIAIYQVAVVVAMFGFNQVILIINADPARGPRRAREVLAVGVLAAFAVTAALYLLGPYWIGLLGLHHFGGVIAVAVLWTGPSAACLMLLSILRADDRLMAFCVVSVLSAVGGQVIGISLLLGRHHPSPTAYAWGGVIAQVIAMVLGLIAVRPRIAGLVNWSQSRYAFRLGLPLTLGALSVFVLNAGDRIVVQRDLGAIEVGRYQIAYTVGSTVILLLTFLNQTWLPDLLAVPGTRARWRLIEESRDVLLGLLAPIVLGLTAVAPLILRIVAPSSFDTGTLSPVVLLVAIAAFPVADAGASGQALLAMKRTHAVAVAATVAAVGNIVLNIVLVPHLGIRGSALATVLAFGVQAAVSRAYLANEVVMRRPSAQLTATVLGTVAAAGLMLLVPALGYWVLPRCLIALGLAVLVLRMLAHAKRAPGRHRYDLLMLPYLPEQWLGKHRPDR